MSRAPSLLNHLTPLRPREPTLTRTRVQTLRLKGGRTYKLGPRAPTRPEVFLLAMQVVGCRGVLRGRPPRRFELPRPRAPRAPHLPCVRRARRARRECGACGACGACGVLRVRPAVPMTVHVSVLCIPPPQSVWLYTVSPNHSEFIVWTLEKLYFYTLLTPSNRCFSVEMFITV